MKFFVGVFVVLVSLLAFGVWTDAYSHVREVKAVASDVHARLVPPNNIDPGDFVHAD